MRDVVAIASAAAGAVAVAVLALVVWRRRVRRARLTERERIALEARKAMRQLRRDADRRKKPNDPFHLDNGSNEGAAASWGGGYHPG